MATSAAPGMACCASMLATVWQDVQTESTATAKVWWAVVAGLFG